MGCGSDIADRLRDYRVVATMNDIEIRAPGPNECTEEYSFTP